MMDPGFAMTCEGDHDTDSVPHANNASRFPTEIYIEIFDIMKSRVTGITDFNDATRHSDFFEHRPFYYMKKYKRDLSNWALTSRSFRNICQQRVFENINLVGDEDSSQGSSASDFCREIASGNDSACMLASYVKKCRLECWDDIQSLPPRIQAIPCMTNLETLFICATDVTRELLGVIGSLKLLKSCSFYRTSFELILPGDIRPDLFSSTLTSFTLWKTLWGSDYEDPGTPLAKPLVTAIPASLKFLRADAQEFTRELINTPPGHTSGLVGLDLRLYREQLEDVRRFLTRLRSLYHLRLYNANRHPRILTYSLNLSPSALPLLTDVHCPPQLALELVKGRPVRHLTLTVDGEPLLVKALTSVDPSIANQSFDILNPSAETPQSLPSIDCPQLTTLWIGTTSGYPEDTLENVVPVICRIWQNSLSLHSLHIRNLVQATYNLPHHNLLISQLMESFPALTTISFTREVEWQYNGSGRCWKPVIHRDSRNDLRRYIMKHGEAGVTVDFEGCYASLFVFTEDELDDVLPKLRAS